MKNKDAKPNVTPSILSCTKNSTKSVSQKAVSVQTKCALNPTHSIQRNWKCVVIRPSQNLCIAYPASKANHCTKITTEGVRSSRQKLARDKKKTKLVKALLTWQTQKCPFRIFVCKKYCWRKKSCSSWQTVYPIKLTGFAKSQVVFSPDFWTINTTT